MNWYDTIEEPIRPLVKLLRDNGYNTFTSCGHNMWVGIRWEQYVCPVDGFLEGLKRLLKKNGYINYRIFCEILHKGNGEHIEHAEVVICIPKENGFYSETIFQQFNFSVANLKAKE